MKNYDAIKDARCETLKSAAEKVIQKVSWHFCQGILIPLSDPFRGHAAIWCTWFREELGLLPSLQTSMVYPSRPEAPMFSGWLQMIVTEVSFLSSTKRSTGALVGSADAT